MERILRGIGDGVVVTDPDGQVRLMNSVAERFLDIDERYAFGRDLFSEQPDAEFVSAWEEYTAGDEPLLTHELALGGSAPRVFAVTISRIHTPEGRPAGFVSVLRDVTGERRVERMKRDFVSNMTHELRTPLASIRGFTATILRADDVSDEDRRRFLGIIEKEAERLQHLIEDLLALSSLDAGREALQLRSADFTHLLRDAKQVFAPIASERGVTLDVHVTGPGSGVFDPEKMRRVVDNLISNALKHTSNGGRVDIDFARSDDRLECSVRDTGKGMPPEVLERIFDRFYSASPVGAPAPGNPRGSGLGLHIVQKLVELHHGEITAESHVGEGSTFRFVVPAVPRMPERKAAEVAVADPDDPLVDDPDPEAPAPFPPGEE
jgi:two-component system phosphate regulon sensor histidine kinase PhoR